MFENEPTRKSAAYFYAFVQKYKNIIILDTI